LTQQGLPEGLYEVKMYVKSQKYPIATNESNEYTGMRYDDIGFLMLWPEERKQRVGFVANAVWYP
jgi:hypothetical protein